MILYATNSPAGDGQISIISRIWYLVNFSLFLGWHDVVLEGWQHLKVSDLIFLVPVYHRSWCFIQFVTFSAAAEGTFQPWDTKLLPEERTRLLLFTSSACTTFTAVGEIKQRWFIKVQLSSLLNSPNIVCPHQLLYFSPTAKQSHFHLMWP